MQIKLLTLRYSPRLRAFDDEALTTLLSDKQLLSLREHFFVHGDVPHLLCLVSYQAAPTGTDPSPPPPRRQADPLPDIPAENRGLLARLREWRSTQARDAGVPPYVVFTNKELYSLLQIRPASKTAMLQINGIGKSKADKYGDAVLRLLGTATAANGSAS